jgi:predicted GTPase
MMCYDYKVVVVLIVNRSDDESEQYKRFLENKSY